MSYADGFYINHKVTLLVFAEVIMLHARLCQRDKNFKGFTTDFCVYLLAKTGKQKLLTQN